MSIRNETERVVDEVALRRVLAVDGTVLLDDASGAEGSSLLFSQPHTVLSATNAAEVTEVLLHLDAAVQEGAWVAGYLTYEAGAALHGLRGGAGDHAPLAWFGVYDEPERVRIDAGAPRGCVRIRRVLPDRDMYGSMFETVRQHIREGDVYQINLTGRVLLDVSDDVGAYLELRARQPVPFGAFVQAGDRRVLSFSPERFFKLSDGRITARPMKGTAPRHADPVEDSAVAQRLREDAKNRAENLMIVDLLRNDLSVVCETGSVVVPRLFHVEPHPTLWQMTSDVEGDLRPDATVGNVLAALFPCGSITGAPKRRAMQIIDAIEPWPRGVYCGAIGYASPGGVAEFNVAIRTIEITGDAAVMGTGGGIVWDGDPHAEYDELLLKAQFLQTAPHDPPDLLETMRLVDGSIQRLERHMRRMRASASELGHRWEDSAVRNALRQASSRSSDGVVRLTLAADGTPRVEFRPFRDWPSRPVTLAISGVSVHSQDLLLRHKTTARCAYDAAAAWALGLSLDEALLLNERGEVTEGTISNLFVERDGQLYTPPLSSGVLPGVLRAELVESGSAIERVLHPRDLETADALYVGNSVRGLARAVLVNTPGDERVRASALSRETADLDRASRTPADDP